jgi:hypothetical protein
VSIYSERTRGSTRFIVDAVVLCAHVAMHARLRGCSVYMLYSLYMCITVRFIYAYVTYAVCHQNMAALYYVHYKHALLCSWCNVLQPLRCKIVVAAQDAYAVHCCAVGLILTETGALHSWSKSSVRPLRMQTKSLNGMLYYLYIQIIVLILACSTPSIRSLYTI